MKPSDLKAPFSWSDRKVTIEDRIFYIPSRCETYDLDFPGWHDPLLFGNALPLHVEYCSGNGAWVVEKAISQPYVNWIAVEKKFMRVRKIWSKIKNLNLNNLIVVCGEAFRFTKLFLPPLSVSAAYINFPDPWPKKRHAKHRLIQPKFVDEVGRVLTKDSSFTLVTDDADYSFRMIQEMEKSPLFTSCFVSPFFINDIPGYGTSYFDQLWREKGKEIRFHQYRKLSETRKQG